LNEFFAIVTDPRRVGNPRTQKEALVEVEKYFRSQNIATIHPGPDTFDALVKSPETCHCEEWSDEAISPNGK
jgi:hypothetical protein